MAKPSTIAAAGTFHSTKAGQPGPDARIFVSDGTTGTIELGSVIYDLIGDPATKSFTGTQRGGGASTIAFKIQNRNLLKGKLDGSVAVVLDRAILQPIPAGEASKFDAGPTGTMKTFLETVPDYRAAVNQGAGSDIFWYAFGHVLYRGRLDGSARLMCIASDPGPTECLPFVRRCLVGDAGQRTQGFLSKVLLTRSYVLVNAFAYALHPGHASEGPAILKNNATLKTWRHAFYDRILDGGNIAAIVAFGGEAQSAYDVWSKSNPNVAQLPVFKIAHPSAIDRPDSSPAQLAKWATAVTKLRTLIAADAGSDASLPNYGVYASEADYQRIPRWDLPKAAPAYAGDDSWGRAANPRHNNCANRPSPDNGTDLVLSPAAGQGKVLRYKYKDGVLVGAKTTSGTNVPVDADGIPT